MVLGSAAELCDLSFFTLDLDAVHQASSQQEPNPPTLQVGRSHRSGPQSISQSFNTHR